MRVRLLLTIAVAVAAAASLMAEDVSSAKVEGQIKLVALTSGDRINDFSQAVVWLVPLDNDPKVLAKPEHSRMVQKDKQFQPNLLVLPVGSVVDFPNLDPWFHNVFSLFRGKRFDLGLYQAGSQRSVRFDNPGVSYLFCNIHPEMTAVIVVVDSNLYATTDGTGRFSIPNVPPGRYRLHLFHRGATLESLETLQRTVEVDDRSRTLAAITIPVQVHAAKDHKNKYGNDYDPQGLKPEY